MFYSSYDKIIATLSLASIVAGDKRVMEAAQKAGYEARNSGRYMNYEMLLTIYSKIDLENEAHCECARKIVKAYSDAYLDRSNAEDTKSEVYATPIVVVCQTKPFVNIITSNNFRTRFLNASIYKLLEVLNEDDPRTDDLYITSEQYKKMLSSNLYTVFNLFNDIDNKKVYPTIVSFVKSLEFVDDMNTAAIVSSLLKYYDIYVNHYPFELVRDIIIDTCKEGIESTKEEARKKILNSTVDSSLLNDFISDTYACVINLFRNDESLSAFTIANVIAQNRSVFLSTLMKSNDNYQMDNLNFVVDMELSNMVDRIQVEYPKYFNIMDEVREKLKQPSDSPINANYKEATDYDSYLFMRAGIPDLDHTFDDEDDYGVTVLEASYQKTGNSIRRMDVRSAYKLAKDNVNKLSQQLDGVIKAIKNFVFSDQDMDYIVVEGKKFTFFGLVRKVLGGVALFSFSKVFAICYLIVKWAGTSKAKKSSKRKMLMLLAEEIEITNEKIEDAKAAGDNKAKYALMRSKKELENARDRIKYNMGAEVKSKAVDDMIKRAKGEPISQRDRLGRYQDGHTTSRTSTDRTGRE